MRPRIRTLKPEFFPDERVCSLSRDARLVAIGLLSAADDRGRLEHSVAAIRGYVFPHDQDVSDRTVAEWVTEVVSVGIAAMYKAVADTPARHVADTVLATQGTMQTAVVRDGDAYPYLWLPNFWRHQVINKPTESKLPAHPADPYGHLPIVLALAKFREDSRSAPVVLPPSRAGARFPVPVPLKPLRRSSKTNDKGEPDSARERTRRAAQDKPPASLPAALAGTVAPVLAVLSAVQSERGGQVPTVRGVGLAIARFPDRDHQAVVRELEHWALAGAGQARPVRDWARTLATFLERSPAGSAVRAAQNGHAAGRPGSVGPLIAELDQLDRQEAEVLRNG
jgi:hypothetical protein